MRRSEREVTDSGRIDEIIMSCPCCRLGFYDEGEVYIVPLNFGYVHKEGKRIFYFHGANEGRKFRLMEKNPSVGFELDTHYALLEGDTACRYSARYQSVIGTGKVSLLTGTEEKKTALQAIMLHSAGKGEWDFSVQMLQNVCVFQLEAEKLSCKEH